MHVLLIAEAGLTTAARSCHFLLLVQEKVTKEKHTPAIRPPGILPCGFADASGISRRYIPVASGNGRPPADRPGFAGVLSSSARRIAGGPLAAILAAEANIAPE